MKDDNIVKIYPFNEKGDINLIKNSRTYQIANKINKLEKLTQDEKSYIYKESRFSCCVPLGCIAERGVCLDFRSYFKRYFVEDHHGYIYSRYAPNKTTIRLNESNIYQIVECQK